MASVKVGAPATVKVDVVDPETPVPVPVTLIE
jgi:hypothetical protein